MLNRYQKYFFIVFLVSLGLFACKTTKQKGNVNKALDKALLWKIVGGNNTTPSYLFGTIHMIDKDDYFLPQGLLPAFEASEKVFFEVDMNEMSDVTKMMGLMKKALMKEGKSLGDYINDEDYTLVKAFFAKKGLPIMVLERMKPMFLDALASMDMDPEDMQNGKVKSYELELAEMAKEANKPIFGLETLDFQMSIFDTIPYQVQADMLVKTVKSSTTSDSSFFDVVKSYKSMDVDGMHESFQTEDSALKGHLDIFLDQRNISWIPIMKKAMHTKPCLFAVGAGHLGGANGVIRLLRKEGYKVTPIHPIK